jgi:hypothetical protein
MESSVFKVIVTQAVITVFALLAAYMKLRQEIRKGRRERVYDLRRFWVVGRMVKLPPFLPFVQINAVPPGLARRVDREERLDALAFTTNREGVEKLVPALRGFFKVRSLRSALEPFVEFDRHRRKEMPSVYSIQQVFSEGAAAGISGRPDPDSRHGSADGVDNLG